MNWIILEITTLIVFALLLWAFASRRRPAFPLLGQPTCARRSFCSSDLHRAAEEADRNDVRLNTWRWRYWKRHGRWPTDELDRLVADSRRMAVILRRQAA